MFHEVRPYVSDFSLQAVERATDLDGVAHKKTGHKRSIMWRATKWTTMSALAFKTSARLMISRG
jgi:hypothetical protein